MKPLIRLLIPLIVLINGVRPADAQGTAFTYQGRLNDGANPAVGIYDLRFTIYDSLSGGLLVAGPLTNSSTAISNGMFTVALDFGSAPFNGALRWMEIGVRTNGGGAFVALTPRQQLTPTPYAIYAAGASATGLSGTVPSSSLGGTYGNAVTFNNGANSFDGTFTGQFFGSAFTGGLFTGTFLGSGSGLGDVWHTTGNFGTTPNVNFLGTADNQPLELRVNNQRALRLEPATDINVGFTPNVIGGHKDNFVFPGIGGAVIGGGGGAGLSNSIASTEGVIAGGYLNHIEAGNAHASTIGGGFDNDIASASPRSVIAGGHGNRIGMNSQGVTISGGEANVAGTNTTESVIAGGSDNVLLPGATWSAIGGGFSNSIAQGSGLSVIAGGDMQSIGTNSFASTIAGGNQNAIQDNTTLSFIGGGEFNMILNGAPWSTIAGGTYQTIGDINGFIGGGWTNTIGVGGGSYSAIVGGQGNSIQGYADHSTIGGGQFNSIVGSATYSVDATIAGGALNQIMTNSISATIGGGGYNRIRGGLYNTIAGGYSNGAGPDNLNTNADAATVGGGGANSAEGTYSTVPGGRLNWAAGRYSFAAGLQAKATNDGAFVWADSIGTDLYSSANDQFLVRASGGVYFSDGPAGVNIDQFNLNNGSIAYGLKFGTGSGEGIASKRTGGGNQYGLDFYTQFSSRMSIAQDGTVSIPGVLRLGVENGNSEPPSPAGLVVRRINSISVATNQVVARTDNLTLERDGSHAGMLIRFPNSAGRLTINYIAMNNVGALVTGHFATNVVVGGTLQLFSDAQRITHVQLSFGDTFDSGHHLTQVVLDRFDDTVTSDFFWSGTLTSTFNQ
jgi:hypothetical protein